MYLKDTTTVQYPLNHTKSKEFAANKCDFNGVSRGFAANLK